MTGNIWNPWHGCQKYSEGCENCYVYRRDESVGKNAAVVTKTSYFDLPLRKNRAGEYRIPPNSRCYVCMTSDFFVDKADGWRPEVWRMIRQRPDVSFMIITKRITRFLDCIPPDWGEGYPNVAVTCTMESQRQCDIRFPFFNSLPIAEKNVASEPLLTPIDMSPYLNRDIRLVVVGGESGSFARECDYRWVLDIRRQCVEAGVSFYFKQTGALFRKDGRLYHIERKQQSRQAHKAGIDVGRHFLST